MTSRQNGYNSKNRTISQVSSEASGKDDEFGWVGKDLEEIGRECP